MKPTSEQEAIFNFVEESNDNLTIVARAGAAKTTTLTGTSDGSLKGVVQRLPKNKSVLCLAFNVAIAKEMADRVPTNAEARTLNSVGHRALGRFLPKWPKIKDNKTYLILKDEVGYTGDREEFGEILQGVRAAKAAGYINHPRCKSLLTEDELWESMSIEYRPEQRQAILDVLDASNKWLFEQGIADFADQILISTTHKSISFDRYDVVLVDEAQDLSALNHAMLQKIAQGRSRVIVAGDPLQAIYGFRGAHEQSMEQLSRQFDCSELKLCTTFRCAKSIVRHVKKFAPDMVAWQDNPEGLVTGVGDDWEPDELPLGSAVLCRRNAPLVYLSLVCFLEGINAEYVGHDTLATIQRVLKGIKNPRAKKPEVRRFVIEWQERNRKKYKDSSYYEDLGKCLLLLADEFESLRDINSFLRAQKSSGDRIKLMTVHKAKGLEFPTTFILDSNLFSEEGQESNIQYVAKTRSIEKLIYINS